MNHTNKINNCSYIFCIFLFINFWNFRYPISPRVCACSQCGEVFPKLESLELHQAVRHAGNAFLFYFICSLMSTLSLS